MSHNADELVRRLYEARVAKKAARVAMVAAANQHGMCTNMLPQSTTTACYGVRFYADVEGGPILNKEYWCEACKARQPSWEVWREKANAAGSALRSVLAAGKRLARDARPRQ